MKKEIKTYSVVCDCCEKELHDNGIRKNNGEFSEPYLKRGNIDLCLECAGKIFYKEVVRGISELKLKEFINSLKTLPVVPTMTSSMTEKDVDMCRKNNTGDKNEYQNIIR